MTHFRILLELQIDLRFLKKNNDENLQRTGAEMTKVNNLKFTLALFPCKNNKSFFDLCILIVNKAVHY